jgi:integrase
MPLANKYKILLNKFVNLYKPDLSQHDKMRLSSEIVNFFMDLEISDRTKKVYVSQSKKYLMSKIDDKEFTNNIKPDIKFTKKLIKEDALIRDNKPMLDVAQSDIDLILSFKDSENIYEMNIYLLFVTGRRYSELFNGKFQTEKGVNKLRLKGLLKNRATTICTFPVIGKKSSILKKVRQYQKLIKDKNEMSHNRTLLRHIKKIFGDEWKPHTLRGVYAKYLYKNNNDDNMRINSFIQKVLCHQSINASLAYTNINLV